MDQKYTLEQLNTYSNLYKHLTGLDLKELRVTEDYSKWYREELQKTINVLGMDAKVPAKLTFKGIILL